MEVSHDPAERLFEIVTDGYRSRLYYARREPGVLDILSTFVPTELRGRRLGAHLVASAAAYAKAQGLVVETSCWYAAKVLGDA